MRFQNDGVVFQVSDSLEPKHYLIMLQTPMDNIKYYARRRRPPSNETSNLFAIHFG